MALHTVVLRPNSDLNSVNLVTNVGSYFAATNDPVDTHDGDLDYIHNIVSSGGSVRMGLGPMPSNFSHVTAVTIRAADRGTVVAVENTLEMNVRIDDSNGNILVNQVGWPYQNSSTYIIRETAGSLLSAYTGKAYWDTAQVYLSYVYGGVIDEGLRRRVTAIELVVTYDDGVVEHTATAAFNGTADSTIVGVEEHSGAVSAQGVAGLTWLGKTPTDSEVLSAWSEPVSVTTPATVMWAAAMLSGSATVNIVSTPVRFEAIALAARATTFTTATVITSGAAIGTGSATLTALPNVTTSFSVQAAGTSTTSIASTAGISSGAAVVGDSVFTATPSVTSASAVVISGDSTFASVAVSTTTATVVASGISTAGVSSTSGVSGASTIAGVGSNMVVAFAEKFGAINTISSGDLTAVSAVAAQGAGILGASSSLTVTGQTILTGTALLTGTSTVTIASTEGIASTISMFAEARFLLSSVQTSVPAGDMEITGFVNENGLATNLFQSLDETSADDTDFIRTYPSGDGTFVYEAALSDLDQPISRDSHYLRYRIGQTGTAGTTITVYLRDGTTTIASWVHNNLTETTTFSQLLSEAQANTITNYTNLRLRFEVSVA